MGFGLPLILRMPASERGGDVDGLLFGSGNRGGGHGSRPGRFLRSSSPVQGPRVGLDGVDIKCDPRRRRRLHAAGVHVGGGLRGGTGDLDRPAATGRILEGGGVRIRSAPVGRGRIRWDANRHRRKLSNYRSGQDRWDCQRPAGCFPGWGGHGVHRRRVGSSGGRPRLLALQYRSAGHRRPGDDLGRRAGSHRSRWFVDSPVRPSGRRYLHQGGRRRRRSGR